jgi:hypothetical protein
MPWITPIWVNRDKQQVRMRWKEREFEALEGVLKIGMELGFPMKDLFWFLLIILWYMVWLNAILYILYYRWRIPYRLSMF